MTTIPAGYAWWLTRADARPCEVDHAAAVAAQHWENEMTDVEYVRGAEKLFMLFFLPDSPV